MIITSDWLLKVGHIYSDKDFPAFQFKEEVASKFRFMVLRKTDKQEYEEYCKREMNIREFANLVYAKYFYEVSLD